MRSNPSYNRIDSMTDRGDDEDEFRFREKASLISKNLQQFKRLTSSVRLLADKLGTSQDNIDTFQKLESDQKEANEIARKIGRELKELAAMHSPHIASQRIRETQVEKLSNGFSTALREFQNVQRNAASRERASVNAALKHAETSSLVPPEFSLQDTQMQDQQLIPIEEIEEREKALHKIEQDILGVNDIMRDLAVMIHEQGEVIDSIEAQVESTHVMVESANTQLIQARQRQGGSRNKMCIVILVLIVFCLILALIIYLRVKKT